MTEHDYAPGDSDPESGQSDFKVDETWVDRLAVVSVSGTVDMLSAPWLADAIGSALAKDPAGLIIDLSKVDFLASAGIRVLLEARDNVVPSGRFGVVADGPATSRPLTLLGINEIISIYRTLDDALTEPTDA
jgi:anti-sigma B factor antagonist